MGEFLSRRLCDNIKTRLQDIFLNIQDQISFASPKEMPENILKMLSNYIIGGLQFLPGSYIDSADSLLNIPGSRFQISFLLGKHGKTRFIIFLIRQGGQIHIRHPPHLIPENLYLFGHSRRIGRVFRYLHIIKFNLIFFSHPLPERLRLNPQLGQDNILGSHSGLGLLNPGTDIAEDLFFLFAILTERLDLRFHPAYLEP